MKSILAALMLAALVLATPAAQPRAADAPTTLFVNLTTDDAWTNEMGLFYAEKVLEAGHPVVVFLNVRAVRIGVRDVAAELKPAQDALKALMAKGAKVHVCGMCTKRAGLTQEQWIEGSVAGGAETVAIQMNPATRVLSY